MRGGLFGGKKSKEKGRRERKGRVGALNSCDGFWGALGNMPALIVACTTTR